MVILNLILNYKKQKKQKKKKQLKVTFSIVSIQTQIWTISNDTVTIKLLLIRSNLLKLFNLNKCNIY